MKGGLSGRNFYACDYVRENCKQTGFRFILCYGLLKVFLRRSHSQFQMEYKYDFLSCKYTTSASSFPVRCKYLEVFENTEEMLNKYTVRVCQNSIQIAQKRYWFYLHHIYGFFHFIQFFHNSIHFANHCGFQNIEIYNQKITAHTLLLLLPII